MEDILFQTSGINLNSDHFREFFTFIADKFEDFGLSLGGETEQHKGVSLLLILRRS